MVDYALEVDLVLNFHAVDICDRRMLGAVCAAVNAVEESYQRG